MVIPGYQIGREVSSGTYSSVYNALDIETSMPVSIRVFNQTLSTNEHFLNQLKDTVSPLVNQAIGIMIPVRQVTADTRNCYLVTDFFHNSSHQFDNTLSFSTRKLLRFGLQLASTLELLHSRQIVHGGIESANILFTDQSNISLGFIALHKSLPATSHLSLPPSNLEEAMYLAPEAFQGLTAATDFYALGILLYQLISKLQPFNADNISQLEQQKSNYQIQYAHSDIESLKPFFDQILNPDPQKRITSAQQFHQLVESCGFKLRRSQRDIQPDAAQKNTKPTVRPQLDLENHKTLLVSALILILVVGISFFIFSDTTEVPTPANSNVTSVIDSPNTAPPPKIINEVETANIRAEALYQNSLQSVEKNNFGSALISVNNALKENPLHQSAQQLKRQIEQELEARALISHAEKQMAQQKLTKPAGDNALETYQQLAHQLPADDNRAQDGIQKIAAYYYGLAQRELKNNKPVKAQTYISSGLEALPGYGPLNELGQTIQQQKQRLTRQRQQEKIRAAKALKEKQLERERQQLAQKQQQERTQQQLVLKQQQQIKQQKISVLLNDASQNLKLNRLSLSSITSAKSIYTELTGIDQYDERVAGLKRDILDAYGILATRQKNATQYNSALITLREGLSMDSKNEHLSLIKNEITALVSLQKKPVPEVSTRSREVSKQVPVIGTF